MRSQVETWVKGHYFPARSFVQKDYLTGAQVCFPWIRFFLLKGTELQDPPFIDPPRSAPTPSIWGSTRPTRSLIEREQVLTRLLRRLVKCGAGALWSLLTQYRCQVVWPKVLPLLGLLLRFSGFPLFLCSPIPLPPLTQGGKNYSWHSQWWESDTPLTEICL